MTWLITKYLITAALVVAISEMAKRTEKIGALLASLPLVTILALIWLYVEKQPDDKIADQAWYTFWYVLPTLPMFLAFPYLLPRIGFGPHWALQRSSCWCVLEVWRYWCAHLALTCFKPTCLWSR